MMGEKRQQQAGLATRLEYVIMKLLTAMSCSKLCKTTPPESLASLGLVQTYFLIRVYPKVILVRVSASTLKAFKTKYLILVKAPFITQHVYLPGEDMNKDHFVGDDHSCFFHVTY